MSLAAALSELDIAWVDGVVGKEVSDRVLPGDADTRGGGFTVGDKGSWRAHMEVLQRSVFVPLWWESSCSEHLQHRTRERNQRPHPRR